MTGLLVAAVVLVTVLGATLRMYEGFTASANDGVRRTSAQDAARTAADRVARDLRNLASPTPEQPEAVDLSGPQDLIFKTVDPDASVAAPNVTNTKRVRYCLDPRRRLLEQTQIWSSAIPPPPPAATGCPSTATGWSRTRDVAGSIVNGTTPIFSYNAAATAEISEIHVNLIVDTDLAAQPPATSISTGVFLRNQNRRPTAAFAAPTRTAGGFVLNGSASTDPEGAPLRYAWFDGATQVGTGITFTYTGLTTGVHTLTLVVTDPSGLSGTSAAQSVTA